MDLRGAAVKGSPLLPGDPGQVGPFTLLGRLGSGGMGMVYLGRDATGAQAAVKVVHGHFATDRDFRLRFEREVRTAALVSGAFTARIPRILNYDAKAERQWIATELIDGMTLEESVARQGPLPESNLNTLALGVAQALAAVHDLGVVHRDLKPSNIMLAEDGPKIIDFGIARDEQASVLTQTGVVIGTLAWMAPEQVSGTATGPKTDVFAWGLVIAYAATGRHPYGEGPSEAIAFRPRHQEPDLTGLPEHLRRLVCKALSAQPDARPDAMALLHELRSAGMATEKGTGRRDGARAWYTKAARAAARAWHTWIASGGDGYSNYKLGLMAEEDGDRNGARARYSKAAAVAYSDAIYKLGLMAEEDGDMYEARAMFSRAAFARHSHAMKKIGPTGIGEGDRTVRAPYRHRRTRNMQ